MVYGINADFRIGIQFEMMMADPSIPYIEKITRALKLYYVSVPNDIKGAIDQILWFYSCDLSSSVTKTNKKSSSSQEQMYSYEQDQYMIYTAFLIYYHIDLNAIEYLHWWKFKQLFNELPEEAKIKKVMMYRTIKLSSSMSSEQKQFYAEMKSAYKLKDNRTEKQKANSFASVLASGMHMPK